GAGAGAGAGGGGGGGAGAAAAGAGGGAGCGSGSGAGAGAGASASAGAAAGAAPAEPSPMTASFTPTATVSPSGTRISLTTPDVGDGTSESTLSVETSNSGSSAWICSPTCLNHLVIVPSVTVSPSWGIVTSTQQVLSRTSRAGCGRSARAPTRRTAR